jgi:hypothetical protein
MGWIALLGVYHGINPGMGWLFAVALGLQQRTARGVWRALPPIALGHAAAVGVVLLVAGLAQVAIPLETLQVVVGVALVTLGGYRLWRHRHPRFGGMQVGFRDLTIWSFLMASAHGAGFMVLPFVLGMSSGATAAASAHAQHATAAGYLGPWTNGIALAIHTGTYLGVAGLTAWVVYRWLGLAVLRTAWFNLDWLWAAALVITGAVVLLA